MIWTVGIILLLVIIEMGRTLVAINSKDESDNKSTSGNKVTEAIYYQDNDDWSLSTMMHAHSSIPPQTGKTID